MVALAIPVLKPVAKKSAKKDALVLTGHEAVAARVRDRAREIETLEAEQKTDAASLIETGRGFRREAEAAGNFHKTVKVAVDEDSTISLVFSDRYSPVAVENEDALRGCLGSQYDALFRRECRVSQRKDMSLEALKALLGDKFDAFAAAFDVKEVLVPVDGFMETRANLRPSLSEELNATVDGIVDQVQFKPSVRTK
jgi:hypothetical protein